MNQAKINEIYASAKQIQGVSLELHGKYDRDKALLWFVEEVGELIAAIRKGRCKEDVFGEFSDVLVWVVCLSNILDIDLSAAFQAGARKEAKRQLRQYGGYKYASKGFSLGLAEEANQSR